MATAIDVRNYAIRNFVDPARRQGISSVTFTATDIHKGLGLERRFPLVCSAIDADKFLDIAKVILVTREGPKQSSTVRWTFDLR